MSATRIGGYTLALRIRFDGQGGLRVLRTNEDDIQSLIPWLREILTSLRLPHPKPSNVIKPDDYTSDIEMYWDVASGQSFVRTVTNRCKELGSSTLQDVSIDLLMVFVLPEQMREIPDWQPAAVTRPEKSDELEAALLGIFRGIGLPTPNPVQDPAVYISAVVEKLHAVAASEAAARVKAEKALAEERARHARILQDIQKECREPFVVPALLEAFVALSRVVDDISDPS